MINNISRGIVSRTQWEKKFTQRFHGMCGGFQEVSPVSSNSTAQPSVNTQLVEFRIGGNRIRVHVGAEEGRDEWKCVISHEAGNWRKGRNEDGAPLLIGVQVLRSREVETISPGVAFEICMGIEIGVIVPARDESRIPVSSGQFEGKAEESGPDEEFWRPKIIVQHKRRGCGARTAHVPTSTPAYHEVRVVGETGKLCGLRFCARTQGQKWKRYKEHGRDEDDTKTRKDHGREDGKSGGINSRHVREIQEWMLKQLELARRGEKNGNRREKGSFEMDDIGDDRNSHRSVRHRSTLRASDIARAFILPPSYSVHRLENHAENRDRPPARASCPKYGRVGWDTPDYGTNSRRCEVKRTREEGGGGKSRSNAGKWSASPSILATYLRAARDARDSATGARSSAFLSSSFPIPAHAHVAGSPRALDEEADTRLHLCVHRLARQIYDVDPYSPYGVDPRAGLYWAHALEDHCARVFGTGAGGGRRGQMRGRFGREARIGSTHGEQNAIARRQGGVGAIPQALSIDRHDDTKARNKERRERRTRRESVGGCVDGQGGAGGRKGKPTHPAELTPLVWMMYSICRAVVPKPSIMVVSRISAGLPLCAMKLARRSSARVDV
ncbi:hypothetical protein C8R43DRAFT_950112 [Mycena crocata]|nr:hypothetical protein C8R43DRAFT_950112 [Mycena crocata]